MVYWKCDNSSYLPLDSDKSMGFYRNENYIPSNYDTLSNQRTAISESSSINNFKAVSVISSNGYYGYVDISSQQNNPAAIQPPRNGPVSFKRKEKEANEQIVVKRMKIEEPSEQELNGAHASMDHYEQMDVEESEIGTQERTQHQSAPQKNYLTVKLRNNSCNAKCNKVVEPSNQLRNQKTNEKNDQVLLENLFTSIHGSSYYQYLNYD